MQLGPVHPCPVCGSPEQTCTHPGAIEPPPDLQDEPTPAVDQGPGELSPYDVDGTTLLLTEDDARRRGLIDDEEDPP